MTNQKKLKVIEEAFNYYHDRNSLTSKDEKELLNLVNELYAAISVTRCCTELKDKKITDLLNWVKSDLAQETNVKLGKTVTPYSTEKLKFLNKLLEIENL